MELIALVISAAAFIFLLVVIIMSSFQKSRIQVEHQIKGLAGEKKERKSKGLKQRKKKSRIPISRVFAEELSTAGIRMRPEEFLIMWVCLTLIPSGILILFKVNPISIIAVALIGIIMPLVIVRRRKDKQLIIFEKQLGDALMLIGNCLRSGLTFQQSLGSIAKEMEDPIAREFSRVVNEIHLGSSLDNALTNMMNRVKSTDLMLTVSAVQIQHQVGGNMIEILGNIAETIKERQKLKDDIRVMTATGRTSGVVVGLIPVGIGGILMLINPEYVQSFFDTTLGIVLLAVAGIMEILGFLAIRKIVTIKY